MEIKTIFRSKGDTSWKQKVKVSILTNTKAVTAGTDLLVFASAKQAAPIRLEPAAKQAAKKVQPPLVPKSTAKTAKR